MAVRADDLLILVEVARSGSLLRAAEALGIDHSTVSRRLADLDRQLGSPATIRTAKGSRLTELGESLLESATRIEQAVADAQQLAHHGLAQQSLRGLLRISTVEGFGTTFVVPVLARMQQANPGLVSEVITGV